MTEIDLASAKEILNNKLSSLTLKNVDDYSNYKFMNLLRSILVTDGIPLETASMIVAHLDYDLSAVPEDDDYLGDVAQLYAVHAVRVYNKLKATNWHRHLNRDMIVRYFANCYISL